MRKCDWSLVTSVSRSAEGSAGVFFVTFADGHRIAIKGTTRLLQEHIATTLFRRISPLIGGADAPETRIVQYGEDVEPHRVGDDASSCSSEWSAITEAVLRVAGKDTPDGIALKKQLNRAFYLVMDFIPDASDLCTWLFTHHANRERGSRLIDCGVLKEIGGMMAFDVLINNSDRLPLLWNNEGNLGNILISRTGIDGVWRAYAIDQAIATIDATKPAAEKIFSAYSTRVNRLISSMKASVSTGGSVCPEINAVATAIANWTVGSVVLEETEALYLQRALEAGLLALAEGVNMERDVLPIVESSVGCVKIDWENVWRSMCGGVHARFFADVLALMRDNVDALRLCAADPRVESAAVSASASPLLRASESNNVNVDADGDHDAISAPLLQSTARVADSCEGTDYDRVCDRKNSLVDDTNAISSIGGQSNVVEENRQCSSDACIANVGLEVRTADSIVLPPGGRKRPLKVLAVQRSPVRIEEIADVIKDTLESHKLLGVHVDILLFPECFVADPVTVSVAVDGGVDGNGGDVVRALTTNPGIVRVSRVLRAHRTACLLGTFDEVHPSTNKTYCTSALFDVDGSLLGTYRKRYPTCGGTITSPGDECGRVFVSTLGRIGVAICYDAEHDDIMDSLIAQKADVILNPVAILRPSSSGAIGGAQSAQRTALGIVARAFEWRMTEAGCTLIRCDNPSSAGYLGSTICIGAVHTAYAPSPNVCALVCECSDFDAFPAATQRPARERTERRDNSGNHTVAATVIDHGASITSISFVGRVHIRVNDARGSVSTWNVVTRTTDHVPSAVSGSASSNGGSVPLHPSLSSSCEGRLSLAVSKKVAIERSCEDSRVVAVRVGNESMRLQGHLGHVTAIATESAWVATGDDRGRVIVWAFEQNRSPRSPVDLWK
eukprot:Opistho-2@55280